MKKYTALIFLSALILSGKTYAQDQGKDTAKNKDVSSVKEVVKPADDKAVKVEVKKDSNALVLDNKKDTKKQDPKQIDEKSTKKDEKKPSKITGATAEKKPKDKKDESKVVSGKPAKDSKPKAGKEAAGGSKEAAGGSITNDRMKGGKASSGASPSKSSSASKNKASKPAKDSSAAAKPADKKEAEKPKEDEIKVDENGNFIGPDGKVIMGPDGKPLKLDDNGNPVDKDGKPFLGPDGKPIVINDKGEFVDSTGQPVDEKSLAAKPDEKGVKKEEEKALEPDAKSSEQVNNVGPGKDEVTQPDPNKEMQVEKPAVNDNKPADGQEVVQKHNGNQPQDMQKQGGKNLPPQENALEKPKEHPVVDQPKADKEPVVPPVELPMNPEMPEPSVMGGDEGGE